MQARHFNGPFQKGKRDPPRSEGCPSLFFHDDALATHTKAVKCTRTLKCACVSSHSCLHPLCSIERQGGLALLLVLDVKIALEHLERRVPRDGLDDPQRDPLVRSCVRFAPSLGTRYCAGTYPLLYGFVGDPVCKCGLELREAHKGYSPAN